MNNKSALEDALKLFSQNIFDQGGGIRLLCSRKRGRISRCPNFSVHREPRKQERKRRRERTRRIYTDMLSL